MPITRKEALEKSIKLWEELARTGTPHKLAVFEQLGENTQTQNLCFLCEYVYQNFPHTSDDDINCEHCPVWPGLTGYTCCKSDHNYSHWEDCNDKEERKHYAQLVLKDIQNAMANEHSTS